MRFFTTLLLLLVSASAWAQGVQAFKAGSLAQIEARHHGRPFVLLVWSLDCPFCHTSLEVLARARAANPQLEIVTVSTDPLADQALSVPAQARLAALALLDDTWSFGSDPAERLRFALDPGWRGEKPRSYWYDASGKRVAYSGLIKPEQLQKWQRRRLAPR
jgi:hypothetical protein